MILKVLRRCLSQVSDKSREVFLQQNTPRIATLCLNRPASRNSLGKLTLTQLNECLNELSKPSSVRVLLVESTVEKVFCAGADLKERAKMSKEEVPLFVSELRKAFRRLELLPIPTVAVIDGAALGGGLELALCCDLRVSGSGALFGLPETSLAIIPGAGGTQRLPRILGVSKAKELVYTARRLAPKEAFDIGLVSAYSPQGSGKDLAMQMAEKISKNGPIALRAAKKAIDEGMQQSSIENALKVEQECYQMVVPTKDREEGLLAFKEKREPVYTGK